jgi:hypothetical protein
MYSQNNEPSEDPWMIVYRALTGLKYINLFFDTKFDASLWAVRAKIKDYMVCTYEEFAAFRSDIATMQTAEIQFARSFSPRPVLTNIELIEEYPEEEIRQVAPRVGYTNMVPRKQSLFRPAFTGMPKRRSQPIEDEDEDIILTTTDRG